MSAPVFLTAEWRSLVMLNFTVDPKLLLPYVPAGTELDVWQGETLVSLVGFRFLKTRLFGWSIPGHTDFDEVNLRFYVRRRMSDGWRRGVVFIKEVAPRHAIVWVARRVYHENYVYAPLRHHIQWPSDEQPMGRVRYEWRMHRTWLSLSADIQGQPSPLKTGSIEEFITEHYWGYTKQPDGGTLEYEVQHPAWKVWTTDNASCAGDLAGCYGPQFADVLSVKPASCLVAEGSPVQVHCGQRL